jgi:hypothetical protein
MEMTSHEPRDLKILPFRDFPILILEARLGSTGFDMSANCLPACLVKLVLVAGLLRSQAKCNDKALENVQECYGTRTSCVSPQSIKHSSLSLEKVSQRCSKDTRWT